MDRRGVVIIAIGVVLFVVGWVMLINGVEVKVCSTYVPIPASFIGRLSPGYTDFYYWNNIAVNITNFAVKANTPLVYNFTVNDTIGYIYMYVEGNVKSNRFRGFISILNAVTNETILYTDLVPEKSIGGKDLNTTLFFMRSLSPGRYKLIFNLDSDAVVKKLVIYGPSSREVTKQGIEITLEPSESSYKQIKIDYICGIEFSKALIASMITGIGITTIVTGAVLEVRSSTRTRVATGIVKVVRKTKKK